jgi:hypothetical protein
MTSRQQRRVAERAQRKQARREARIISEPRASACGVSTSISEPPANGGADDLVVCDSAPARDRVVINRQNAQHSTGPQTVTGKANSSRNSFKHGLYSKQLVTSDEDAVALDALRADLRSEHQPANQTEEILVNEMAEQFWCIRRARIVEASVMEGGNIILTHLAAAQRMMSSAERGFHKALTTLRQLQKERGFVPQNRNLSENAPVINNLQNRDRQGADAIGFESQNGSSDPGPWTTDHGIGFVSQNLDNAALRAPGSCLLNS